jgi:ATP-dependent Lon protease
MKFTDDDCTWPPVGRWFEKIMLPVQLRRELVSEAQAENQAAETRRRLEMEWQKTADEAAERRAAFPMGPPVESLIFGTLPRRGPGVDIELFDRDALTAAYRKVKKVSTADRDRTKNRVALLEHIASRGNTRWELRRSDWREALAQLREAFPNFEAVLDLIEAELTLGEAVDTEEGYVLPPILLNGAPGCGKTYFAEQLSTFFGTGFLQMSMETAQTAAELVGTAEHWANTQPGRLFDLLIDGNYINPVVLLDEVDKVGGYHANPADKALYALLERKTAKRWSDASLPLLKLDVSHVIWVLTSNDACRIPVPLRSRMRQFDIPPMTPHAARQLVRKLYREEVARYANLDLEPELHIAHCDVLRQFSPRQLVGMIHALVAQLARAERRHVTYDDLRAVGALDGRLVEFERTFGDYLEWTVQ